METETAVKTLSNREKVESLEEHLEDLENRVQLLEIIARKAPEALPEPQPETKKIVQINAKGKKYFCETKQEQAIFAENNPGTKTETFDVELHVFAADKYLNDPENKKQFIRKVGS